MRKIVLPLIETDRSLLALQYAKKHFGKDQAEIIIVMSDESLGISATREEEAAALSVVERKLEVIKKVLDGYQVITKAFVGKAGPCIVKVAREYNADYIVMTKSAKSETLSVVGKTTDYVLNNAYCNVLIISENRVNSGEYKGLIYKKAHAVVNLRGQIGDKQSECLLPSVDADCNYHFDVTVGKIRFFHTAYNPETGNWDMPPAGDQTASIDIAAGESADILVQANSVDGKADRIRIINRGMKQEAVFEYKITAATVPEPLEIPEAPGAMPAPAVISLDEEEKAEEMPLEAIEAINLEEEIFDEMPVPSIYDTAEFEGIAPEENLEESGEELGIFEELENLVEETIPEVTEEESAEEEFGVTWDDIDEVIADDINDYVSEEVAREPEEKSDNLFDWSDFTYDKEEDYSIDNTLTGLEMFTPNESEINSIVDELKDTVVNLDNDIAAREGKTMQFGMPVEDIEDSIDQDFYNSDINIEEFFGSAGSKDESGAGGATQAFDDIFEMIPSRDPSKLASSATLEHDFDEIINEFRTSQMGYVGKSIDDDDNLDEFK